MKNGYIMDIIGPFDGEYRFLSNFWRCEINYENLVFPSVEHAYQAAKSWSIKDRVKIQQANKCSQAKHLGETIAIRADWEYVKLGIMEYLLRQKFQKGTKLGTKLSKTDKAMLIEYNNWHDNLWGQCTCQLCRMGGRNMLGKLLMKIREDIR